MLAPHNVCHKMATKEFLGEFVVCCDPKSPREIGHFDQPESVSTTQPLEKLRDGVIRITPSDVGESTRCNGLIDFNAIDMG